MTSRLVERSALVAGVLLLGACRVQPPEPPLPLDCASIPEAELRFPDLCADAGVPADADTTDADIADAGVDAGP